MDSNQTKLSTSLEDYLEAILILESKNRVARVKDIAALLNVQMSSVTSALKNLRERSLINYEKNSFISLTDKGKKIASTVRKKHDIINDFLQSVLRLSKAESDSTACEIEHTISIDTALRLKNLSEFVNKHLSESGMTDDVWEKILSE
ncbi:MAG: metal-dependent transcriptional regulator [Spirochaetia bacterium]|jgi:DtxR family Mn-dependent transcriptional regulator|nr:metal-dependent transcriptional regulator [Spirochaetia bacterium]